MFTWNIILIVFFFFLQKSLWDTIKNKREGERVAAPRRIKTDQPLKMAANKTFQVSRKQQYNREKPRSPLASLNEGKTVRERSLTKRSPTDDFPQTTEEQRNLSSTQSKLSLAWSEQENIQHVQKNSPLVLLVPAGNLMDSGNMSGSPDASANRPENGNLTKVLNRTLSPIGTPERFKKLMPHIQSDSPLSAIVKSAAVDDGADSVLPGTPLLSLKDALAIIDSDLSHIATSPGDTSSSCGFSDSLESKSGNHGCGPQGDALKAFPDSPQEPESNEPRLTFFVSKTAVDSESDKATVRVKKTSFTSATVTKTKAPVEVKCLSGRKIKKSRRRLLDRTLELSDGSSQCESAPGTPILPVIDPDTPTKANSLCGDGHQAQEFIASSPAAPRVGGSPTPVTFPVTSPPPVASGRFSFSATPPAVAAPIPFTVTSLSPVGSSSLRLSLTSVPNVWELSAAASAPLSPQQDSFPIQMAAKSKKRKSEEYLKSDGKVEVAGKTERVKRSRVVAGKTEASRSVQERRSASQRQPTRAAGEPIGRRKDV